MPFVFRVAFTHIIIEFIRYWNLGEAFLCRDDRFKNRVYVTRGLVPLVSLVCSWPHCSIVFGARKLVRRKKVFVLKDIGIYLCVSFETEIPMCRGTYIRAPIGLSVIRLTICTCWRVVETKRKMGQRLDRICIKGPRGVWKSQLAYCILDTHFNLYLLTSTSCHSRNDENVSLWKRRDISNYLNTQLTGT